MKEGSLILHKGAKACTRDDLDLIPMPQKTETYQPVSHYGLANRLLTISQDIMSGFTLSGEKYGIARDGNQLFAVLQFRNTHEDMGLALGFRNSYDKSMSVGFACGASIFICDNMALTGDIVVMRKHTKLVWEELEERAISACYRAIQNYRQVVLDAGMFKALPMDTDAGFSHLGRLYGHDLLGPRQMSVAKEQWLKPSHEVFAPRTGWSLYNAVTEALKSCTPTDIMERHIDLHRYFKNLVSPVIDIGVTGEAMA